MKSWLVQIWICFETLVGTLIFPSRNVASFVKCKNEKSRHNPLCLQRHIYSSSNSDLESWMRHFWRHEWDMNVCVWASDSRKTGSRNRHCDRHEEDSCVNHLTITCQRNNAVAYVWLALQNYFTSSPAVVMCGRRYWQVGPKHKCQILRSCPRSRGDYDSASLQLANHLLFGSTWPESRPGKKHRIGVSAPGERNFFWNGLETPGWPRRVTMLYPWCI